MRKWGIRAARFQKIGFDVADRIWTRIPLSQVIGLQCNIADAMLQVQMINPDYYYFQEENGDERLTDDAQAEFTQNYEHAALPQNDGGIWALEWYGSNISGRRLFCCRVVGRNRSILQLNIARLKSGQSFLCLLKRGYV